MDVVRLPYHLGDCAWMTYVKTPFHAPIREDCGQVGSLREPPWLKTPCNEHAGRCRASGSLPSCRIWALVQKAKNRRLGLSPHVAHLAG